MRWCTIYKHSHKQCKLLEITFYMDKVQMNEVTFDLFTAHKLVHIVHDVETDKHIIYMYMTLYMYIYLYPERVEGVRVRREGVGGWGVVSERWGQWQWWGSSHAVLPALLLPPLPTESPAAAAHTHTTHTHTHTHSCNTQPDTCTLY